MEFRAGQKFLMALGVTIILFLIGLTATLSDIEWRLGQIEHYIAHEKYIKSRNIFLDTDNYLQNK